MREVIYPGLLLLGGLLTVGIAGLAVLKRRQQEAPDPALPSHTPRVIYAKADESLRAQTLQKRVEAEGLRRRAALVDSSFSASAKVSR